MRRALEHLPAAVRAHGHVGVQDPCSWSLGGRGDRLGGRCHDRRSGCCGPRLQQGRLSAARGRIPVHTEVYFPFLDEAAEFSPKALEALRTPLESGVVNLHRSHGMTRYPARFQLVLAANPCPCGQSGTAGASCLCPPMAIRRYAAKLSAPIRDRVDITQHFRPLKRHQLQATLGQGEPSAVVAARVAEARERQRQRLAGTGWHANSEVTGAYLRHHLPQPDGLHLLDRAAERGLLSPRGIDKAWRVSWTIADLAGKDRPGVDEIGIALAMRQGDRLGSGMREVS